MNKDLFIRAHEELIAELEELGYSWSAAYVMTADLAHARAIELAGDVQDAADDHRKAQREG